MTDNEFLRLDTEFSGEKVDDIKQIVSRRFDGEELKEYVEYFIPPHNVANDALSLKMAFPATLLLITDTIAHYQNEIEMGYSILEPMGPPEIKKRQEMIIEFHRALIFLTQNKKNS